MPPLWLRLGRGIFHCLLELGIPTVGSSEHARRMEFLIWYIIGTAISLLILHAIIRNAVVSALETHYKNVRWYEKTGEWVGRQEPRSFEAGPIRQPKK